jgi:hypothetical protein
MLMRFFLAFLLRASFINLFLLPYSILALSGFFYILLPFVVSPFSLRLLFLLKIFYLIYSG